MLTATEARPPCCRNRALACSTGILRRSTRRRYHAAFFRLRRTFGRLGVPVVCAAGDEPVPLILERINRLRTLRRTPV